MQTFPPPHTHTACNRKWRKTLNAAQAELSTELASHKSAFTASSFPLSSGLARHITFLQVEPTSWVAAHQPFYTEGAMCGIQLAPQRTQLTITASSQHHIWRRRLLRAGAKGIQTVKRIISTMARRRKGIAPFRVPGVYVATITDAALGALNLFCLLKKGELRLQTFVFRKTEHKETSKYI